MPQPEKTSRRRVVTTTLAFAVAIAIGWAAIYVVYRYLASGWKV